MGPGADAVLAHFTVFSTLFHIGGPCVHLMLRWVNWWHVIWNGYWLMPLVVRVGLPWVLLQFLYRYSKDPTLLLDKEAFDKLRRVSIKGVSGILLFAALPFPLQVFQFPAVSWNWAGLMVPSVSCPPHSLIWCLPFSPVFFLSIPSVCLEDGHGLR